MSEGPAYEAQVEALQKKLGLESDVGHADLRSAFIECLQTLTQCHEVSDSQEEKSWNIEELCNIYFKYNKAVVESMAAGLKQDSIDHHEAKKLKIEAGAIIRALQKAMVRFAVCEMDLYYTVEILNREIDRASEHANEEYKEIEWSFDLPKHVAIACRRRDMLSEYMVRARKAKPMIKKLDLIYNVLDGEMQGLLGEKKTKHVMSDFTGQLRQFRFSKAEIIIRKARDKDCKNFLKRRDRKRLERWTLIVEISDLIIGLVKKLGDRLRGRQNTVFLRSWELRLAYEDMERWLERSRAFLSKYEVPEIKFRRDALLRQKDKLYELGTFESFLELLEKMQKGCSFPMTSLKDVRRFEAECFKKAQSVIDEQSEMIEQSRLKIAELACGPDPESIPDDLLFVDDGEEENEGFLQQARAN